MAAKKSSKKSIKVATKKAATKKAATKKVATKKAATKKAATKKKPKKRKSKKDKSKHYVDSKKFFDLIKSYYETDDLSNELAESIVKIANGLSYAPNFINYSYKDEMVGDAILKMFSAIKNKKFNIESGNNPFSYFTTVAFHAFINRIKKEKKYKETVTRYQETVYLDKMTDSSTAPIYVDDNQQNPYDES